MTVAIGDPIADQHRLVIGKREIEAGDSGAIVNTDREIKALPGDFGKGRCGDRTRH